MDYLWTPWRYQYIAAAKDNGCIFCDAAKSKDDVQNQIILRGQRNFIILNRYPYTSGHVMVVPYAHIPDLTGSEPETLAEMMALAQRSQTALANVYRPDGFNLGMNIGRAAGAGVAGHIHMHVLPRWSGDANFMTTVAETRVEPENLAVTYEKLKRAFA
jgi:ATP adenylyltransferase